MKRSPELTHPSLRRLRSMLESESFALFAPVRVLAAGSSVPKSSVRTDGRGAGGADGGVGSVGGGGGGGVSERGAFCE